MEAYLGQIIIFAGNYAPQQWSFCDGSLLPIAEYQALYALLGTTYGGDGRTNFGLPDLRGRLAVGDGKNPNLSNNYALGVKGGSETVTLTTANVPSHTHALTASSALAVSNSPNGLVLATVPTGEVFYLDIPNPLPTGAVVTPEALSTNAVSLSGGNPAGALGHSNVMPCLPLNYIICTVGLYPQQ